MSIKSGETCQRNIHLISEERDLEKPGEKPLHLVSFKADGTSSLYSWPNKKTSSVTLLNDNTFIGVDVFSGTFSTQDVP